MKRCGGRCEIESVDIGIGFVCFFNIASEVKRLKVGEVIFFVKRTKCESEMIKSYRFISNRMILLLMEIDS